jgi:hypothetical protein
MFDNDFQFSKASHNAGAFENFEIELLSHVEVPLTEQPCLTITSKLVVSMNLVITQSKPLNQASCAVA